MSSDKNELLFSQFGINYNRLPQCYRKGTTLIWGTGGDSHDNSSPSNSDHRDGSHDNSCHGNGSQGDGSSGAGRGQNNAKNVIIEGASDNTLGVSTTSESSEIAPATTTTGTSNEAIAASCDTHARTCRPSGQSSGRKESAALPTDDHTQLEAGEPSNGSDIASSLTTYSIVEGRRKQPGVGGDSLGIGASGSGRGSRKAPRRTIVSLHEDIIGDSFWEEHPDILSSRTA